MRTLFYFLMLMVVTGCSVSNSYSNSLDDAQQLMKKHPQKAFEKLNSLDVSQFDDSAQMARWALLYSEAMVASHLQVPSDTIINIALNYYASHNFNDELSKAKELKFTISTTAKGENDALIQALYVQKERECALFKAKVQKERLVWFIVFLAVVACGVLYWQYQRLKLQRLENDALLAEAAELKETVEAQRDTADCLSKKLNGLLGKRFELIGKLCDTYYEAQGTRSERNVIAEQVKAEINSIKDDSSTFGLLESAVNDCRENMALRFKQQLSGLKEPDYKLMVYLACGFSNRAISMLLGQNIDVVYKRKSRLRSRIKEKNPVDADLFLSIF